MRSHKRKGGTHKYGRNLIKCTRYKNENRRIKNKERKRLKRERKL